MDTVCTDDIPLPPIPLPPDTNHQDSNDSETEGDGTKAKDKAEKTTTVSFAMKRKLGTFYYSFKYLPFSVALVMRCAKPCVLKIDLTGDILICYEEKISYI